MLQHINPSSSLRRRMQAALAGMLIVAGLGSCTKFLDKKPNATQVVPSSLSDCQAMLDNYFVTATGYPTNEQSTDDYYLTDDSYNTLGNQDRDVYVWATNADMMSSGGWSNGYEKVLYANTALATLGKINPADSTQKGQWNFIKGQALFYRAFSFYMMAQIWGQPYKTANAATDLGIPLRLTPDISTPSVRATIGNTYQQIIDDLTVAVQLLPADQPTSVLTKARPYRAAAEAALARVYLSMGDYANAGTHANASLQLYSTLMDYNQLNPSAFFPFVRYNPEVLFEASGYVALATNPSKAKIDSNLYASYVSDDLRKTLFFRQNTGANAGTYQFRGNYNSSNAITAFCGLATDEMYLTRAECYARAGNTASAMTDLNNLLRTRWTTGTYTDRTAVDADDALAQVLAERRKELVYRSLRWSDLRRLNQDPRYAITLHRTINGTDYTLPPNDPRYAMLIPTAVIKLEPMTQNPR